MANEFKVKNGLIVDNGGFNTTGSSFISGTLEVSGNQTITGSLNVSSGITGSLFGTASWANNALTASFAQTAISASYFSGSISSAVNAQTASYVNPLRQNVTITGSLLVTQSYISTLDYIDFNIDVATPAHLEGRVHWSTTNRTLEVDTDVNNFMIPVGHMNVLRGKNQQSYTLTKGTVIYISGSQGNTAVFGTASWENDPNSAYTIGIIAQDILTNLNGYAVTLGEITGINTSAYTPGTLLYLSSSGQYTDVKPLAPLHAVRLGQVVIQGINGSLQVKVDNGYEIGELHDVIDSTTSSSYGDLIVKSGSLWTSTKQLTGSYGLTGSISITGSLRLSTPTYNTSSINVLTYNTASSTVEYSTINDLTFTKNIINVGLSGSRGVRYNVIKSAVNSITDASENNTYTVRVYPGTYIEDTITVPSWVAIKGDSSISTIVSASNPSSSIFVMSDQSMVIDMQIQGSTATGSTAVVYSSATTPQRNAIAYVENVRFGTNYTNAKVIGSGSSGNCILQCSNVKYGGYTDTVSQKSFDVGFHVTSGSSGGIGRMQLRNVTSTNGGVAGTDNNQIFALADAPGCTFIVNGCLLTRATGTARGTGFKVYNGGQLRLTGVNFQRWINGIWAPQTGSAPSIDAIALNFENCTYDVLIEHTGSIGKVQGTDTFLKTIIPATASLYEVGQDPRRLTVAKKGGDFTSISASVAWITDASATNRYVIEVGPGQFTENTIDLTGKPYVSIVGSNIQTTQIFPSSSAQHIIKLGINNEVSFLSLANAGPGYAGLYIDDIGDFGQAHKLSFYDCDTNVFVISRTKDTQFYGEYLDYNGTYTYGTRVSASNGFGAYANIENYYQFPSGSTATIGNYAQGQGSDLNIAVATFDGSNIGTAGGTAIQLASSASCDITSTDINNWDYGVNVLNTGGPSSFNINGTVFRNNTTDFYVQHPSASGRFQGSGDHTKITNASNDFYWSFMDINDGEYDITRKLSVTFADGTHTDATTLIFKGSPMGVMQGGEITISGSLTINTAAGFGYLETVSNPDVYKRVDWANSTLTLSANTNNYIYLNDSGVLSAASSVPDNTQNIILGRVVTNATGIEFIDQSPYDGAHTANKLSKFNRDALGPVYADGSIVTENVTPFKLNATAGSYFFSENNFTPAGTSSINFTQYYRSGSGWNRSQTTTVTSNTFDSGSNVLVPLSQSAYTKHTLYLVGEGVDEEYFLVIGQNQYTSLVEAEGAGLPTPPTYFSDGVVSLASIYVRSGSANIIQIQDIRPIIGFRAAGVNASATHGNLLGLSADDHPQYLLVNGTRQMSGNLGLGGNNIYNFNLASGSSVTASNATITSITGSLFGTASWASNSISASFAPTASSADNFTVRGTLTAQTIVAQTITSSTEFITGSTKFGSIVTNTHQFTGSVSVSGSLSVNGNSVVTSNQTSSFVQNSQTSSFVLNSQTSSMTVATASFATSSLSASFASTASFAPLYVLNSQTSSFVLNSQTSSMTVATASFATSSLSASFASTASFAPLYVLTSVTSSMLAPYLLVSQTSSFVTNAQTSSFVTNAQTSSFVLNSQTSSMKVATASFATSSLSSSFASTASYWSGSVLNTTSASFASTASFWSGSILNATSASFATSASYASVAQTLLGSVTSASFASTASFVNTLNQSVLITNALTVGSSSLGATENTLVLGPAPAGGAGEGGQILLQASGGLYISASMLDNYQNQTRLLKGTNAGSNAVVASWNMHTSQMALPAYTSVSSFPGTAVANLAVDSTGSIITVSTSGGTVFPYTGVAVINGGLVVTGSITASGAIHAQANNAMYFRGGDDAELWDINVANTIGIYGQQDQGVGSIKLGSGGGTISGRSGSIGIGTTTPNSASLHVSGNVWANSFTGSLFGTASWANNALTSSYILQAVSASFASTAANATTASYVLNAVSASFASTAALAPNYVLISVTSSMLAPYLLVSQTSSFVTNAQTSSFVQNSQTSSMTVATASFATSSLSASFASTASYVLNAISSSFVSTASSADNFLVRGTLTAQTIVAQTITSSTDFVTGSTRFGSIISNTHQFTGSVSITGSLTVVGAGITGSLFGTASLASTASYYQIVTGSAGTDFNIVSTPSGSIINIPDASATARGLVTTGTQTFSGTKTFGSISISGFSGNVFQLSTATSEMAFASTGHRIAINGYDSTISNRTIFIPYQGGDAQLSVGASPRGNNRTAEWIAYNTASVNAASSIAIGTLTSSVYLNSSNTGTGTLLPLALQISGSSKLTIGTDGNIQISGSLYTTGSITGSLFGTSSWAQNALTASFLIGGASSAITIADEGTTQGTATYLNFTGTGVTATVSANTASINIPGGGGLTTKSNAVLAGSFAGNPKKATVTFSTAFPNTNYSVTVTGEDARSWTIESKLSGSFVINSNSNTAPTGNTYWVAIEYGEA